MKYYFLKEINWTVFYWYFWYSNVIIQEKKCKYENELV